MGVNRLKPVGPDGITLIHRDRTIQWLSSLTLGGALLEILIDHHLGGDLGGHELIKGLLDAPVTFGKLSDETYWDTVKAQCERHDDAGYHLSAKQMSKLEMTLRGLHKIEILKCWERNGWVEIRDDVVPYEYRVAAIRDGAPFDEYWPTLRKMIKAALVPSDEDI